MKRTSELGFHAALAIIILAIVGAIGFAGWRVYSQQQGSKNNSDSSEDTSKNAFVYERRHPKSIKGVLDPGESDAKKLLTGNFSDIQKLGANTFYVYIDYSYENGQLQLTTWGVAKDQAEAEQKYIELIKLAKQKGLAVHVALSFGGGRNSSFGVPIDQFMADVEPFGTKWAKVAGH